jgi:hypothetical protein
VKSFLQIRSQPGLASNRDPPDLCLLSSWYDRCEPLAPSHVQHF